MEGIKLKGKLSINPGTAKASDDELVLRYLVQNEDEIKATQAAAGPIKLPGRLKVLDDLPLRGHQKVAEGVSPKELSRKLQAGEKL